MRAVGLKVDVCTREGMRLKVERLLELLARHRVRASFFLAFGPDHSGRAILRLLSPRFRRKMVRSSALRLYGLRTALSGTLLPARPVAAGFPDLVRRIRDEGHEVALHGFDHRHWQDRLPTLAPAAIRAELDRAHESCTQLLGEPPRATGAPGWIATEASLREQERYGFAYASDLRGGPACLLATGGATLRTPQLPTGGPVVEELLSAGVDSPERIEAALLDGCRESWRTSAPAILGAHAEVEGGPYLALFDRLLSRLRDEADAIVPLREIAESLVRASLPVRRLVAVDLPGRADPVASSASLEETPPLTADAEGRRLP